MDLNVKEGTYIVECKLDKTKKPTEQGIPESTIQIGNVVLVKDITWREKPPPSTNVYIIETDKGFRLKLTTKLKVRGVSEPLDVPCPIKNCDFSIKVLGNASILESVVCRDEMENHILAKHTALEILSVLWTSVIQKLKEEEK